MQAFAISCIRDGIHFCKGRNGSCQRKKLWNRQGRMKKKGRRRARRPENSSAKKCTTFARASMERARLSRRLRSASRRRGAPARNLGRLSEEKLPRKRGGKR